MNASKPSPVRAVLSELASKYAVFRDAKPLAIGINKQLASLHPEIDPKALRVALHLHVNSVSYLKATEKAEHRFGLDGNPAGEVTDEQRKHASEQLRERFKKQAAARREAEEAKKAEERSAKKLEALVGKFGRQESSRSR